MELIRNLDDANMGEVYWRLYRRYISLFIENEADDGLRLALRPSPRRTG
ncbi:hypothetical protein P4238_17395 [Pseudomonas aeruginosa]|nr:hypothetical protein [Pseudomonas aeruginosa]